MGIVYDEHGNPYETSGFQNFDADGQIFNPTIAGGMRGYKPDTGKDSTFTIRIKNNSTNRKRVELFNINNHITQNANATGAYSGYGNYAPFTLLRQLALINSVGAAVEGAETSVVVSPFATFSDVDGSLCYFGGDSPTSVSVFASGFVNTPSTSADVWVSTSQGNLTYKRLLEKLKTSCFQVRTMLIDCGSEAQLRNSLEFKRFGMFGSAEENTLELNKYKVPTNNLTKTVNVLDAKFNVDPDTGIFFFIEPQEDMAITFGISIINETSAQLLRP